jgi:23S rRNA (guanosine2251-2'-O)-methyltransferase
MKKVLILDSIRSVINVGAIFRTADGIGIDKIYLCGYCPTPIDRFGRERSDFAKASLGAKTSWEYRENILELVKELKKDAYNIISVEQHDNSIDYKDIKIFEKNAVIMGNENFGVDKEILNISDQIAELPMQGFKNSLNVSVTTGIVLYLFFDT